MDNDKYIGRLLDNRYEILEVIGTGGMAVVYKARCHRLNRLVAIKILKDDNLDDEDFRRRFHAESQAVAMLSHPNIVSVYDVSTSLMADYIVMELIEGITLKQYMAKKGVLNWKETLHFAMQIAKALEHAHSKGIVHRDIKPHNVMVLKNGSVKVMDFGIARMISRGNTLTKEALGSVHYISPEQARGGRVDDRSDIYSLGVVMYEMMAGRPPYDGESPVSVAIQHINGGAALPSVLNPNIPGGLEQIIMKAMALNISDRYPSATRMLADMDEFRKDPTTLFDYTGLPLDAAIRVQKPQVTVPTKPDIAEKVVQRQAARSQRTASPPPTKRPRENQPKQKSQDEKHPRTATIAIIVCSLVAVIAIGVFLAILLGGGFAPDKKLIEVPQLEGKIFAELQEYPGLTIIQDAVYDENVPAGVIISQQPEAGRQVVENSKVVVKVSLGAVPRVVTMGNLTNRSKDWAVSFLDAQGLGLKYTIKEEYDDEIAEGYVIRTSPQEGAELRQGQTITLWVSKGRKVQIGSMPDVVGENMENATQILENQALDLVIVLNEVWNPNVAAGTILESEPGRGERIMTGQTVTLTVSRGVERKTMPDLVGTDVSAAKDMIISLNFQEPTIVYVDSDKPKGTVVRQSLEKEVEYEITTAISLEVSNGSLMPITKNVIIDLRGSATEFECRVSISRDNVVLYSGLVPKGTMTVILPEQTAVGSATYTVVINDVDGWDVVEKFSVDTEDVANNGQ